MNFDTELKLDAAKNDFAKLAVKNDLAKLPLHLIPPELIARVAQVLQFGAQKYAPRNWERGMSQERVIAAAERHILARRAGSVTDPETQLPHLAHAICELMFALVYEDREMSDLLSTDCQPGVLRILGEERE